MCAYLASKLRKAWNHSHFAPIISAFYDLGPKSQCCFKRWDIEPVIISLPACDLTLAYEGCYLFVIQGLRCMSESQQLEKLASQHWQIISVQMAIAWGALKSLKKEHVKYQLAKMTLMWHSSMALAIKVSFSFEWLIHWTPVWVVELMKSNKGNATHLWMWAFFYKCAWAGLFFVINSSSSFWMKIRDDCI